MISKPQLHAIVKETLHPSSADWIQLAEYDLVGGTEACPRPVNIRLFSRERTGAMSLEYRAEAHFPDTPPEVVSHVFTDANLRRTWDAQMRDVHVDKQKDSVCYIRKSPFPFRPRIFNYSRLVANITSRSIKYHVVLSATRHDQDKSHSSYVQVDDFQEVLVMYRVADGCRLVLTSYEKQKGFLPPFLANYLACQRLPKSILSLYSASRLHLETLL